MNSFLLVCDVFLFVFWKNPRPEKKRIEIIWSLLKTGSKKPSKRPPTTKRTKLMYLSLSSFRQNFRSLVFCSSTNVLAMLICWPESEHRLHFSNVGFLFKRVKVKSPNFMHAGWSLKPARAHLQCRPKPMQFRLQGVLGHFLQT